MTEDSTAARVGTANSPALVVFQDEISVTPTPALILSQLPLPAVAASETQVELDNADTHITSQPDTATPCPPDAPADIVHSSESIVDVILSTLPSALTPSPLPLSLPAVQLDSTDTLIASQLQSYIATEDSTAARVETADSPVSLADLIPTTPAPPLSQSTPQTPACTLTPDNPRIIAFPRVRRITGTLAHPIHPFFEQLHTHRMRYRLHFTHFYSPSSSMCACQEFPVYSSKLLLLSDDVRLPPELDHLCLMCILDVCSHIDTEMQSQLAHWLPAIEDEVHWVYADFYDDNERQRIASSITQQDSDQLYIVIQRRAQQLMAKLTAVDSMETVVEEEEEGNEEEEEKITEAQEEKKTESSSSSSSPLTQLPLVVIDPLATPNPFAPLVGDVGDDDAANDVQRASTTISSACSSSVVVVSSSNSNVRTSKVTDRISVGSIKRAEVVAKPTANQRPCTRACTATKPTHGFFLRLATRPAAIRIHFEKHYLPTSRMCSCDLFPVYASKVEGVPTLPPELNAFCLHCISATVLSLGGAVVRALGNWAPGFVPEMQAYYMVFYDEKEKTAVEKLKSAATEMEKEIEKEEKERRWMCLLERMGFGGR